MQKPSRRGPSRAAGPPEARRAVLDLVATRIFGNGRTLGRLSVGPLHMPCAIGASGVRRDKKEGDYGSPAGRFRLLYGFYRADRGVRRPPLLPMRPIVENDGWCDDPASARYNRRVRLPFSRSCERLWREDSLYDIVIVLDYNMWPRRKRRGSAIFLHCARDGFAPTEGCVALKKEDLRRLLPRLSASAAITIR